MARLGHPVPRHRIPAEVPERQRSAGVLLHVTSLPGPYGIGDLGPIAFRWVDLLAGAGQTWWQILPLGPPASGSSPYQCFSAFAGNPDLISPEGLFREGLLSRAELRDARIGGPGLVEYDLVSPMKACSIDKAWERFRGARRSLRDHFKEFCTTEAHWLDDYASFMAVRETMHEALPAWPPKLRDKSMGFTWARNAVDHLVGRHRFAQFLFFRQLRALREYAHSRGVKLIGDLPIYVAGDSADVWAHPHLFLLDRRRRPTAVAGVPPDAFSRTGQRWGNPLYNWPAARRENYAWWVRRFQATFEQVDVVRSDHFRGFAAYWRVPAGERTAVAGRWVRGPGAALFHALRDQLGDLPVIAEDLGVITPDVVALREQFDLPGMRVLQFGFDDPGSAHLPHNYLPHCVAYTGTHDNDTSAGWYASLTTRQRDRVQAYMGDVAKGPAMALTRAVWASVAEIAIVPLQDVLGLGGEARMNYPGRAEGNWRWRLNDGAFNAGLLETLGELTRVYGRTAARRH